MATPQIKKRFSYFLAEIPERLNRNSTLEGPLLSSLHYFDEKTGSSRQKRADRRGNIIKVLELILPQMDFETFSWGQWFQRHDGTVDFYTKGLDYIQKETGMHEKTISRVMKDLERGGYMKSYAMEGMGKDGKEIRYYSLRKFTDKLFREMGYTKDRIAKIKNWKRISNEKKFSGKLSEVFKSGIGKLGKVFKEFSKTVTKTVQKAIKPTYTNLTQHQKIAQTLTPDQRRALTSKAIDIAKQQGREILDCYKELLILHSI